MGIKTAIIAGLMALAIPGLTGPAIATSGTTSAIAESEVEQLLNLTQDPSHFSDHQSPFWEPFYQPRQEILEENTFAEPFYQPEENQIRPREMTLARGTQGVQVAGLQQRLEAHGFSVGRVDSLFGPRTERALINFQLSKGLRPTGVVDRSTWEALSADPHQQATAENLLKQGDRGSQVRTLQTRLELTGHDPGPIDGIFGPKTLAAVSDFQLAMGLESTGVVDEKTWKLLGDRSH